MNEHREKTMECEKHGSYQAKIYDIGSMGRVMSTRCPLCEKEEENKEIELEKKDEAERKEQERINNMIKTGIPKRYWDKRLDDYVATTLETREVLHLSNQYSQNQEQVIEKGTSIIFYGKPGTGKTHLAVGILHEWRSSKRYINARALTRAIRETYGDNRKKEQDVIDEFAKYGLLVIDEIGKQFMTDNERFAMFDIINERYNNTMPTILISNMSLKDMQEFLGEDTIDRIREGGGRAVKFNWESARKEAVNGKTNL